ncbi:MAG: hypothetical protein IT236_14165 [Bacteroidia bacterium]|nr:hypothetical protein [Bacteroidia bacterium]
MNELKNMFAAQWAWLIITGVAAGALIYYDVTENRVFTGTSTEHFKPTQSGRGANSHIYHK